MALSLAYILSLYCTFFIPWEVDYFHVHLPQAKYKTHETHSNTIMSFETDTPHPQTTLIRLLDPKGKTRWIGNDEVYQDIPLFGALFQQHLKKVGHHITGERSWLD
jgi:hypothetical protein